ncbi:hypothetical protein LSH36_1345g00034 [Paralvinella palmiformis]|uniref:Uncharacterized protein n=1 Tax=Paralvinella palmiformis TaxID=53620 RepID=A0AAD9IUR1_9ANNE|nr:hypothetical protein LSH36_1345g00034 [Paralvinella palmiformis]
MNPATNRRPDFILVQSGPVPQQTVPQPTVPQPTVLQHVATAPVQPATPIPVQPGVAPGTQIYIVSEQYPTGLSLPKIKCPDAETWKKMFSIGGPVPEEVALQVAPQVSPQPPAPTDSGAVREAGYEIPRRWSKGFGGEPTRSCPESLFCASAIEFERCLRPCSILFAL